MGCRQSTPTAPAPGARGGSGDTAPSPPPGGPTSMEALTRAALQEIILWKLDHPQDATASFNRIILKFPTIRSAFASIRHVFRSFDVDGEGSASEGRDRADDGRQRRWLN